MPGSIPNTCASIETESLFWVNVIVPEIDELFIGLITSFIMIVLFSVLHATEK